MQRAEILAEVQRLSFSQDPELLSKTVRLLHDNCSGWNWVGVYLLVKNELVLGPYVGKPTDHTRIAIGVGVCGSAVSGNTNIIVDDVSKRENYLACTLETRSEIVVLIREAGKVVGQFDIDSDKVAAFNKDDEGLLDALATLVSSQCAADAQAHM